MGLVVRSKIAIEIAYDESVTPAWVVASDFGSLAVGAALAAAGGEPGLAMLLIAASLAAAFGHFYTWIVAARMYYGGNPDAP